MAKCHRNDLASVVLDRSSNVGASFRRFSGASFRRKIIDTMRCGGGGGGCGAAAAALPKAKGGSGSRSNGINNNIPNEEYSKKKTISNSSSSSGGGEGGGGSEKLSELLRQSEEEQEEDEVKKKVELLEEMKRVVRGLQSGRAQESLWGAREVRRLTKEDPKARTSLALLGAIPTLVGMLEEDYNGVLVAAAAAINTTTTTTKDESETSVSSSSFSSTSGSQNHQIASLYALLNLGIANDALVSPSPSAPSPFSYSDVFPSLDLICPFA